MKDALLRFFLPCAAVCLSACVGLRPLRTPSGSPEIVVHAAPAHEILRELTATMAQREYRLVMTNERVAVFQKPCEDFDTAFFYGKGWHASADFRATAFLSEESSGVKVLVDLEVVTDPGSPDEARRSAPVGHPEAHAIQKLLGGVVADLALRRHEELWPDEPARPAEPRVWTGS